MTDPGKRQRERDEADDAEDSLIRAARRLLDDTDTMRPYWDRQHDHFWQRATTRITSTVGKWLMGAVVAGFASAVVIYAVKSGWIK
jgi:hypothetical protein